MADGGDEAPLMLLPCTICNRTFKLESLQKHIKVCERNANKKRKTFDSSKQRNQDLAEFLPVVPKKTEKSTVRKSQSTWKEKHLEFVRAVRQARGISDGPGKRSLPFSVAQTRPAVHEKCPHCERNFGPKAFDRHIEWCKEQKARIPKSPASITAKERLEARIKYRAPLAKSKRTLTREKYSALRGGGIQETAPFGSHRSMNCSTLSVSNSSSGQIVTASALPGIKTSDTQSTGSAPSSQHNIARECLSCPSSVLQHNSDAQSHTVQGSNSSPTQSLQSANSSLSHDLQNSNSSSSSNQKDDNSSSRNLQKKNISPCSSLQSSDSSLTRGLQRGSIARGSVQQRSSSPTKRISVSRKDNVSGKGKSVTEMPSSRKQNSAVVNLQDIFSSSCNIARLNPSRKSSTKNVPATAPVVAVPRSKSNNKEDKSDSVIDEDTYDPYVSAERQMMELLSHGDWPKKLEKENEQQKQQQLQQQEQEQEEEEQQQQQQQQLLLQQTQVFSNQSIQPAVVSSISTAPNELRTSPTSAFTKYSPIKPQTDVPVTVNKSALDYHSCDFDDLIISGHNPSSLPSPHNVSLSSLASECDENNDNVNNNNNNNTDLTISLSNLSLCSIPNFDFNFDFDISVVNRNTNRRKKYRKKLENAALALQQSVSLYHPGPLAKDEVYLQVDDADHCILHVTGVEDVSSTLHPRSSCSMSILDPTPSASDNSEELNVKSGAKKLPELSENSEVIIHVEDELTAQDSHINRRSVGSKISGDSAYSSLNRKSPMADVCSQALERHLEMSLDADHRCLSSSGSESSLPPLSSVQVSRHDGRSPLFPLSSPSVLQSNSGQQAAPKMSKFCHECGSKYPITLAKFCCECGVKRLLI